MFNRKIDLKMRIELILTLVEVLVLFIVILIWVLSLMAHPLMKQSDFSFLAVGALSFVTIIGVITNYLHMLNHLEEEYRRQEKGGT